MITRRRYNALPYIYNFSIYSHLVPVEPEYIYASDVSEGNPVTATGIIIGYLTMGYTKYTVQELNETLKLTYESLDGDGSVLTPSIIKRIYFTDEVPPGKYPLRIDFDVYSNYFTFWEENADISVKFDHDGFNNINTSISIGDHYLLPSLYSEEVSGQIVLPVYDSDITITEASDASDSMTYHTETLDATFSKDIYPGYEDIPEYTMNSINFTSTYGDIYIDSITINGYGHIGIGGYNIVDMGVVVRRNGLRFDLNSRLFGYNESVPNMSITIGYYSFN